MSLMVLKLAGALVFVLGLILVLQRASRRWGGSLGVGHSAEKIRLVGQRSLAPRVSLALVQVMGRNLLLGVSPQGVQTVADLGAVIEATETNEGSAGSPSRFAGFFSRSRSSNIAAMATANEQPTLRLANEQSPLRLADEQSPLRLADEQSPLRLADAYALAERMEAQRQAPADPEAAASGSPARVDLSATAINGLGSAADGGSDFATEMSRRLADIRERYTTVREFNAKGGGGMSRVLGLVLALGLLVALAHPAAADPTIKIGLDGMGGSKSVATTLQIILLLTVLSLVPAILLMVTSFARIVVVLSFLRQAMATPQMPPNQVMLALALFLTLFVMGPTIDTINKDAVQPYLNGQVTSLDALKTGAKPVREFMLRQTREKDLALFVQLSKTPRPETTADLPMTVITPAFMISELKTAFEIGFMLYLPFLIIDLVIASVLMSMGMLMLPPAMISLPFKILLFVLVDGWNLIVKSLVAGFR